MTDNREGTPRGWADYALPTAEQLADWMGRCTDDERVDMCRKMLDSAEIASRCFIELHDGLKAEVDHLRRVVRDASLTACSVTPDQPGTATNTR